MQYTPESQNAEVDPVLASKKNEELIPDNTTQTTFSESEFTRTTVENLGNLVRLTDQDEATGLELFCYLKCGPEDSREVRECRGVVFNGQNIVMRAFPYTIEFSHKDDVNTIKQQIEPEFKNCKIYTAEEGALIRMFYFGGKWFTCTHRKLNAFRSKWASKESFGTAFKKALESEIDRNEKLRNSLVSGDNTLDRFQSILDKDKQYMFLILHNEENRIVCSAPSSPTFYHVGTFVNNELVMTENINVPYPEHHNFNSVDEMIEYVSTIDIRKHQGLIVFAPNNKQYKILNHDYLELFRARGNEPSIKYRYLQVRMNSRMVNMLYHLYPECGPTFDEYENCLYAIAKKIHSSYVKRHIKSQWSTLPVEEYAIDRTCHSWHEEDRKNNRVTLDKVFEVLNEQSATNLNKMIRRYHEEQHQQKEVQEKVQIRNRSNTISSPNTSPQTGPIGGDVPSSPLLSRNRDRILPNCQVVSVAIN